MVISRQYLEEQLSQFQAQRDEAQTVLTMTEAGIRLVQHQLWYLDQPEESEAAPNLEVVAGDDDPPKWDMT